MFHDSHVVKNEVFKPITFVIGIILGYISPKAFPKECCYYGAYEGPKFFMYPPGEIASRLLVLINPILFP